ncbi:helix-turn-helix transcriptional regulator [Pontibacillus marinus]|uniref:HTH cro/C1-type domain-containing protein n=1 Tax=Pontibacillus marinus BH030004 = DSM 16465 TaxID=1385511 RepID=A0A0A5HR39_9BACI|nr:helix-turn-helix transcriptional regulator [Pontibacillus marinus]KGX86067.1 hypothetical protein N783_12925 [Pontibacillus marinus BH030004 = DSM 16465]
MNKLSELLRLKRKTRGLSQEFVCDELYEKYDMTISQHQLSKYETGRTYPDFELLHPLLDVLHISYDEAKHMYLQLNHKYETLLEMLEKACMDEDNPFAKNVFRKLILLSKTRPSIQKIKVQLYTICLSLIFTKNEKKIRGKITFIQNQMLTLPKSEQMAIIEYFYIKSKKFRRYTYYVRVMEQIKDVGKFNIRQKIFISYQLATCLYFEEKYVEALTQAKEAYRLMSQTEVTKHFQYSILARIGHIYIFLGLYKEALESYEALIDLNYSGQDPYTINVNKGYIHYKLKQFDQAKVCWDNAIQCAKETLDLIYVYPDYCFVLILEKRIDEAKQFFSKSDQIITKFANSMDNPPALYQLALHKRNQALFLVINNKHYEEAVRLLIEAEGLLENSPYKEEIITTWLTITYTLAKNAVSIEDPIITKEDLRKLDKLLPII